MFEKHRNGFLPPLKLGRAKEKQKEGGIENLASYNSICGKIQLQLQLQLLICACVHMKDNAG